MFTDTENTQTLAPVALVALAVTAIGGLLYLDGPLESRRPTDLSTVLHHLPDDHIVTARLWQDPLHAIHTHWRGVNSTDSFPSPRPPTDIARFAEQLLAESLQISLDRRNSLLRLLVMVRETGPQPNFSSGTNTMTHRSAMAWTTARFSLSG